MINETSMFRTMLQLGNQQWHNDLEIAIEIGGSTEIEASEFGPVLRLLVDRGFVEAGKLGYCIRELKFCHQAEQRVLEAMNEAEADKTPWNLSEKTGLTLREAYNAISGLLTRGMIVERHTDFGLTDKGLAMVYVGHKLTHVGAKILFVIGGCKFATREDIRQYIGASANLDGELSAMDDLLKTDGARFELGLDGLELLSAIMESQK